MPIEIRELIIKAEVAPENAPGGTAGGNSTAAGNNGQATEAMIALCVEKVLQALKEKNER
ncbi:DUF5908 family protein [Chitinophaga sp. OAE865]|uniref:DUF5908 family protein n=1 Tax=Chitinophaga sp. OAE865 TaxID=2817898 RepID=UPI001AE6BB42